MNEVKKKKCNQTQDLSKINSIFKRTKQSTFFFLLLFFFKKKENINWNGTRVHSTFFNKID